MTEVNRHLRVRTGAEDRPAVVEPRLIPSHRAARVAALMPGNDGLEVGGADRVHGFLLSHAGVSGGGTTTAAASAYRAMDAIFAPTLRRLPTVSSSLVLIPVA